MRSGILANGLKVQPNASDDVLLELIARAAERYEGGPQPPLVRPIFQLRIARVAGANHVAVSFADEELEKSEGPLPKQLPQRR